MFRLVGGRAPPLARVRASYEELLNERESLGARLDSTREAYAQLRAEFRESKQRFEQELAAASAELEALHGRGQVLGERLQVAERELSAYRKREVLLTKMLESAKHMAAEIQTDARTEAGKTLKKAREREADILKKAERVLKSAEAEKRQLHGVADELRADLSSVLISTLERLRAKPTGDADEDVAAEAPAEMQSAGKPGRGVVEEAVAAPGPWEAFEQPPQRDAVQDQDNAESPHRPTARKARAGRARS
jgi:chromosome segregation ATPase